MSRPRPEVSAWVRPEVGRLPAYQLKQHPHRFKLDQNEVPWDLPRELKEAVGRRLAACNWARYPDFHADSLRRALGRRCRHPWQGILVGNGSNELLAVALEALTPVGGEVLALLPAFEPYRVMMLRAGAVPRFLGPRRDLALPLGELGRELEANPRRPVLLASPNNPTGEAVPPPAVAALLDRLEAPLLLDNAYGEFSRHDYLPLLERHPNLVIFRTFSKAWSLAGLRLGYLLAAPELVAELLKAKLPYNLGCATALAGEEVLGRTGLLERRVRLLVARRRRWAEMLTSRGFHVFPSEANFLLVRCPGGRAGEIWEALAGRGVLVRDVSRGPGLAGCLRVSVGSGAALRATARALDELLGSDPGEGEP